MHAKKFSMLVWFISIQFVFATATDSPIDEHGYCGRVRIPSYPPASMNSNLVTVNTFFRHAIRADYRRTTCFPDGAQTQFKSAWTSSFDIRGDQGDGSCNGQLMKEYARGFQVGELLDYAETQMSRLARYLQQAYPRVYTAENLQNLFLRSTDVERTLGSMKLLLRNIAGGSRIPSFTLHTDDFEYDPLNLNCQECRNALEIANSFTSSEEYQEIIHGDEFTECANRWTNEIGTSFDITQSFDCLMAPACANVALPGDISASEELLQCVSDLTLKIRRLRYGSPRGTRFCQLATFPFIHQLVENIHDGISGLWAAHDDTLVCVLSAAGLWNGKWPRYASFLTVETYSDGKMRVIWDGFEVAVLDDISSLTMPGISNPKDYKEACNVVYSADRSPTDATESLWVDLGKIARAIGAFTIVVLVVYF